MTIAAGYVCDDGVILCADTQETIPGFTKTDANKLIAFPGDTLTLLFAGAGNNAVQIEETVNEIALKIATSAPSNVNDLRTALREVLNELFPKSDYPRGNGAEVNLLMAVQSKTGVQLFNIADCNFSLVHKQACIGSGLILAKQLLQRHYSVNVQLPEAAIICIYVLYHVKKWVDGCGGNTDIAIIPKSGANAVFIPSYEVEKIEKCGAAYDDAVRGLLLAAPRTPKNPELFKQYLKSAEDELLIARTAFQDWEDVSKEVAGLLGMNYEEMMKKSEEAANEFLGKTMPSASQRSKDQQ